jgi:hypothetical protein
MNIFSRLLKNDERQPAEPIQASAGPPGGGRPSAPASQPRGVIGASSDKTTPMVVVEPSGPPPPPPPRRSPPAERIGQAAKDPTPPPLPGPPAHRTQTPPADGAVEDALDRLFPTESGSGPRPVMPRDGVSTPLDQAAVRATFEDLAVLHVRPLRTMMIELRFCDSLAGWVDVARASMRSLRTMAEPLEMTPLCRAIDGFMAALDVHARSVGSLSGDGRERLLAAYAPLVTALPRAFALDGDRDRREPILLVALLRQVSGLDPLMIQRLAAVGLLRLETLMQAKADEIAVMAQIPAPVCVALATKMQELRGAGDGAVGLDSPPARRALQAEVRAYEATHQAFEKAAAGWSTDSRAAKSRHRRQRELAYLRIVVALARAGEVDLARQLQTFSTARRIEELDRRLREPAASAQAR